jgi:hypothetical protein
MRTNDLFLDFAAQNGWNAILTEYNYKHAYISSCAPIVRWRVNCACGSPQNAPSPWAKAPVDTVQHIENNGSALAGVQFADQGFTGWT